MSTLRVLLVEHDPNESRRISSALADADHAVVPTNDLDEASEALLVQKFDAVLLGSLPPANNVADFTAQLRRIEKQQHASTRTPILSFSSRTAEAAPNDLIDAHLPASFEPSAFANTVHNLAANLSNHHESSNSMDTPAWPVFEIENFKAQVAYDDDLLVEIIDLFLAERTGQVAEMHAAISAGDYAQLARTAHTIKGSLGSLHAIQAKLRAQELEFAAKKKDELTCRCSLAALESDLSVLEPLLLSLRVSSSSR